MIHDSCDSVKRCLGQGGATTRVSSTGHSWRSGFVEMIFNNPCRILSCVARLQIGLLLHLAAPHPNGPSSSTLHFAVPQRPRPTLIHPAPSALGLISKPFLCLCCKESKELKRVFVSWPAFSPQGSQDWHPGMRLAGEGAKCREAEVYRFIALKLVSMSMDTRVERAHDRCL